jgi:hypothetical protein
MALPKYLYVKHPDGTIVSYPVDGENDDNYVAKSPIRIGTLVSFPKDSTMITGQGDDPIPLTDDLSKTATSIIPDINSLLENIKSH